MDRKELVRQYKQTARPMGVFRVRNTQSGKSLICASANLPATMNSQRWQLGVGLHENRDLQQDWNAIGAEGFVFEILDTLTPSEQPNYNPTDDLRALEQLWHEKICSSQDHGYDKKPKTALEAS